MYIIIQQRWIRGSSQNGEAIINSCARRKEALGLARHHFKSNMDMIIKHNYPAEDYYIDEENNSIALADEDGLWYYTHFYVEEKNG